MWNTFFVSKYVLANMAFTNGPFKIAKLSSGKDESLGLVSFSRLKVPRLSVSY